MTLVDYKNRKLKIGERVRVEKDIPSSEGMLYKNSIVRVENVSKNTIRVKDELGKIFYIESKDLVLL